MFGGQIANVEMVEGLEVRATGMMLAMNLMQQSMGRGVKTILVKFYHCFCRR